MIFLQHNKSKVAAMSYGNSFLLGITCMVVISACNQNTVPQKNITHNKPHHSNKVRKPSEAPPTPEQTIAQRKQAPKKIRQVPTLVRMQPVNSPQRHNHSQDNTTPKRSNVEGSRQKYVPAHPLGETENEWDARHESDNASIQLPPDIPMEPLEASGMLDKRSDDSVSSFTTDSIPPSIVRRVKSIDESMDHTLSEALAQDGNADDEHSQSSLSEMSVTEEV